MTPSKNDITILRDLVKQTMDTASQDYYDERREMWADFNSLRRRCTPILVLDPHWVWHEIFPQKDLQCEHPLFRSYESWLRLNLYQASFGDDCVLEPWITVEPEYKNESPDWTLWGISHDISKIKETMAYHHVDPPIKTQEDFKKLIKPIPIVDEIRTEEKINMLKDAVGDLITVLPDYLPNHIIGGESGLSYTLGYLLGHEEMLYQFYDQPEMVHALSKLVSETRLANYELAEKNGWFTNINQTFMVNPSIQAMAHSREIPSPGPMVSVPMSQHWIYDCCQEFECVSPEMFNEFHLQYQKPIYEKFAFLSFGCCENLTDKLKYLMKVKNLRRVAVTPWADPQACAKLLEDKYVISYRPNPAEMVATWDQERVRKIIRRAKEIFTDCYWEVNLKDFITVEHDKNRISDWVKTVRDVLEE